MTKKEKSKYLWYTRNKNGVKGPFTIGMIQRFVLIGRLKQDDEVSYDKRDWQMIHQVPELIPEEMRNISSDDDHQRLLQAQLREDERAKDRRRAELGEFQGRRNRNDRRQIEDVNTRIHREARSKIQDTYIPQQKTRTPATIAILLIAGLLVMGLFVYIETSKQNVLSPDCNSSPVAGVNWNHCQMEGVQLAGKNLQKAQFNNTNLTAANLTDSQLNDADLAYANLGLAKMRAANLSHAVLKGANLRNADCRNANFNNADLSYADLRNADIDGAVFQNAILYKAIWIDGSLCLSETRGVCNN